MDVIKDMAINFCYGLHAKAFSLENFDNELNSKLIYITKQAEKIRFISYLNDIVETKYQAHMKVCTNPNNCSQNKEFEIALYSIKQQYDDYNASGYDTSERLAMQFFSDGKYFDAFTAIKECVKLAKHSIILIDNYVDTYTLSFFSGKEPLIKLNIVTSKKSIKDDFLRATKLYNKQYENIFLGISENYHDRFLILDETVFYHIGASIKDAGNKVFMFSQIEDADVKELILKKFKIEWKEYINI